VFTLRALVLAILSVLASARGQWQTRVVTSNGLLAAVIRTDDGSVAGVFPRTYRAFDSARVVTPFLRELRLRGLERPVRVRYLRNTHIVEVEYRGVKVSYFAPFTIGERVFYAVVEGEKPRVDSAAFHWTYATGGLRTLDMTFGGGAAPYRRYFLFAAQDSAAGDDGNLRPSRARLQTSGGALLEDEVRYMRFVIDRANLPPHLSPEERNIAEQSITVLKMSQVSLFEPLIRSRGQILASLPPGEWNIAWVRDGCYAILALDRVGLFEEARDALRFFLNAGSGYYMRYLHADGRDYGVGVPYRISVCRYFGDGAEESDFNPEGPNIEFDGFGLFLTAYCDYVARSGDTLFVRESYPVVAEQVAEVILRLIAPNGCIRQDSGPWERHLPGKQYAFTSIVCARGLGDFADMGRRHGAPDWQRYDAGAERIREGIRRLLVVGGKYVKGNVPARRLSEYEYFDAASFEAFGLGVLRDPGLFASHLQVHEKYLRIPGKGRGFRRVNGGDGYDSAEWVFLDLRVASAMSRFGMKRKARSLIRWVTEQSARNQNLIAELYGAKTAAYEGAVPMAGFGAGAYLLALADWYAGESTGKLPRDTVLPRVHFLGSSRR
jgi:GH15 family glucan-1,4-alpha-glucosidase